MSSPEATVTVIGADECPLYRVGDTFKLSGQSLLAPGNKPTCLILVGDITKILVKYEGVSRQSRYVFDCSGCTGLIRLEYQQYKSPVTELDEKHEQYMNAIADLLGTMSFFQNLNEQDLKELICLLRVRQYNKGEYIIRKGEPGRNLFIIVYGKVEVLGDAGIHIAYLEQGEVFGEMSLLSGNPVGATIQVVADATVLCLNAKDFRRVLNKFPSLQMYLARLLAQRLARTNVDRADEFASGVIGSLSEMPPSELFQIFHINQKTGLLTMRLQKGPAELYFRDGQLISARYNQMEDRQAFFELLKERSGRFKFVPGLRSDEADSPEMGNFMQLLMDGLRRMDEEASCAG